MTIGAEDDAAPWSYADGSGYVNDLVREAYRAVGWTAKYEVLPYSRCKLMAERGTLVSCFTTGKTPETEAKLQFPSAPVIAAQNVLYTTGSSPLKGCNADTWGRKISVGFVTTYEYLPVVEALRKSSKVTVSSVNSELLSIRMLDSGRIDAALITVDPVKRIELVAEIAKVKPNFKVLCNFGGMPSYVAFSRAHPQAPAALAAYNKGMALILKNGTVARLRTQWAAKALTMASAR